MAAGSGTRMGASLPKQFLPLDGKAILQRTMEKFISALGDVQFITVLPKEYLEYWRQYCISNTFLCPQTLVEGGITRFHSVRNALKEVPDGALVAIHDGVRPLVSEELLRAMLTRMEDCRALIPVTPLTDTLIALKKNEDESFTELENVVLDRSSCFAVQTPQIFLSEDIKSAYTQAYELHFTDDASVARKKEIPLSYILGERYNIKITTPEDYELAKALYCR